MMDAAPARSDPGVLTPKGLRLAVGVIAILLPFVLAIGKVLVDGGGVLGSISDYYYTGMRNVFVGALSAFSVFLASYRGYGSKDNRSTNLAAVLSLGVAFFPTTPAQHATSAQAVIGKIHLACAAGFFVTIALISIMLFTKTGPGAPTARKLQRNRVYVVCGWVILACVAVAFVLGLLSPGVPVKQLQPVFWLEAVAVVAFGVSWFVKSEAVLSDRPGADVPPLPGQGSHAAPFPG